MTEKNAVTDYPVHDLLARRWSPLSFAAQPVEDQKLRRLFEASRWAPSSYNEQPWRFLIARKDHDPQAYALVLASLVEANQVWARQAPVLGYALAKLTFERNGKPNRHAWYDTGLAMGNLLVQATELGLHVHQMGGFNPAKAKASFSIPDDVDPVAALAIGYAGEASALPADLRSREQSPRLRKQARDLVFTGAWGIPAELF
ncbi:MAG: nitroreductase family protein [Phycisphaeraceae bacterium]|nr:nitroreductase family protein [Phycisphaeraceae bacterium]